MSIGLIQLVEGLKKEKKKTDFHWESENYASRRPLDLNCNFFMGLQPVGQC